MARQLTLIEIPPTWRLDDATREAGRRGVAEARASLQAALTGAPAPRAASAGAPRPGAKGRRARSGRARSQNRSAA